MMAVGQATTSGQVDSDLINYSLGLRDLMQQILNLSTWINGQGNGLAYLEQLGYSSEADEENPGGVSDAQMALNYIAYLNTVAGVYYGTATQGTEFNFNNELSALWNGR
jgi:hypothetical protein